MNSSIDGFHRATLSVFGRELVVLHDAAQILNAGVTAKQNTGIRFYHLKPPGFGAARRRGPSCRESVFRAGVVLVGANQPDADHVHALIA